MIRIIVLVCVVPSVVVSSAIVPCGAIACAQTAEQIKQLESRVVVLGTVRQPPLKSMVSRNVDSRLRQANRLDRQAWERVATKEEWRQFVEPRLAALRDSLGRDFAQRAAVGEKLELRVTGKRTGDGYTVENLLYRSRRGLWITANLYRPAKAAASMPTMIICHSHQSTKHSGWRQDMGATWARAGCLVLIPDHLGHGERRQHPFGEDAPHDYHFRYDLGLQLHLVGESLMGWMVDDLLRGVELLASQRDVDPRRIVMISEPAGGGDVAAVAAALDSRIRGAMVQNFGGPEPETPYPLDEDADESFDFSGSGSWESTRNLRLSASDGFLPWSIVASIAPRSLIYFHEFYWDREHDPVWKRLQRVYGWERANDRLLGLAGRGFVVGSAPENSHWLPGSRELLYPVLERWYGIPNPRREFSERRPESELHCLTADARRELSPPDWTAVVGRIADERLAKVRARSRAEGGGEGAIARASDKAGESRRVAMQRAWRRLLGDIDLVLRPRVVGETLPSEEFAQFVVDRVHLQTETGIVAPLLVLMPKSTTASGRAANRDASREKTPVQKTSIAKTASERTASEKTASEKPPVVVALSQAGKELFLRQRSEEIASLLKRGVAVCLIDVRGTGETSLGESRDRRSAATTVSSSEQMLGRTMLGGRLRDLRAALAYLRTRGDLDMQRLALWGDSFTPVNTRDAEFAAPHTAAQRPAAAEPLGGLLALLGALFEPDVKAVYVRGGLSDFRSALERPFCFLPHDVVVPNQLIESDLPDLAAELSPLPLRLVQLVDAFNVSVPPDEAQRRYKLVEESYSRAAAGPQFTIEGDEAGGVESIEWLATKLRETPRAVAR